LVFFRDSQISRVPQDQGHQIEKRLRNNNNNKRREGKKKIEEKIWKKERLATLEKDLINRGVKSKREGWKKNLLFDGSGERQGPTMGETRRNHNLATPLEKVPPPQGRQTGKKKITAGGLF